jgi:hypothetical protein
MLHKWRHVKNCKNTEISGSYGGRLAASIIRAIVLMTEAAARPKRR